MAKWRTLVLATTGFNISFLVWFSFAPFTGSMSEAFGLSLTEIGLLASAAVWLSPPGRIITGWLADRYGAPRVFAFVLGYVGIFSIASAFAQTYVVFFIERLIVGSAGITFAVGVQHVSQWFPEEQLGTAEGIYAGIGNAGAAVGALVLPRLFEEWSGPLFQTGWRASFFYTGCLSLGMAVVYGVLGDATPAQAVRTQSSTTVKTWVHTATRYGVLALALGYLMSFGLELSLKGWLPTYFQEGFGSDLVIASTFMAVFSLAAGLVRPFGGWISDVLVRRAQNVLPMFHGRYREQWTVVCLGAIVVSMAMLALAGRTGSRILTVAIGLVVGLCCGLAGGAIFAQVPAMFPHRTGTAAGIIGGIGSVGGIGFPLFYAAAGSAGYIHTGYLVVAVCLMPIVLVNAWIAQPERATRAHIDGVLSITSENAD